MPNASEFHAKTTIFQTHVYALAVSICIWLERAGIPALCGECRQPEGKYEVNVPAQFAAEALQVLGGWLPA